MNFILGMFLCVLTSSMAFGALVGGAKDGSGLQAGIAVDMNGQFKAKKTSEAEDRFVAREAEIQLFAPIDHLFDGRLSMAAHQEDGESSFELHEASLTTTKLVPRSRIRLGQFFLGVGRLNQFHRHDWPMISAPEFYEEYFGEEGALDAGVEYSLLWPLPFVLETTFGVTNGWTFGHSHVADEEVEEGVLEESEHGDHHDGGSGEKPRKPTHYGRVMTYGEVFWGGGVQTGLNYLSRTDADNNTLMLLGLDVTAKWRKADYEVLLVQAEVWQSTVRPAEGDKERSLGAYVMPLYGFSKHVRLGVRFDYAVVQTLKNEEGAAIANQDTAVVPTLVWKPSEFSKFAIAYSSSRSAVEGQDTKNNQIIELQTVFLLGAHPSHEF